MKKGKIVEVLKKEFIDWAFSQKNLPEGKFEIAMQVWIEKELEILKLKEKLKKKEILIKILKENVD